MLSRGDILACVFALRMRSQSNHPVSCNIPFIIDCSCSRRWRLALSPLGLVPTYTFPFSTPQIQNVNNPFRHAYTATAAAV